jgi:hypothetical protein
MANKGKYLDVRVICPYYRKDNNSIDLNCECIYNEISNIMRFNSPQAKNIHKRKYCADRWHYCPYAQYLNYYYENF